MSLFAGLEQAACPFPPPSSPKAVNPNVASVMAATAPPSSVRVFMSGKTREHAALFPWGGKMKSKCQEVVQPGPKNRRAGN
jgi:hypothetical protein